MTPCVFFDLDGVLADFVRGAFRLHGRSVPITDVRWDFCTQLGFNGPLDPTFWAPMDRGFWAGLDWLSDGWRLLAMVQRMLPRERIAILTSAAGTDGCVDGKRAWLEKHAPWYLPRLFTGQAKHLFAGPSKILVDDNNENVRRFADAGGLTVLVPRPWNERGGECDNDGAFDVVALTEEVRDALRLASRCWSADPVVSS